MSPTVTVVIPVRDEEERIAGCLEALATSDVPHDQVEVLVVDGGSADGTVDVARRLLAAGGWWHGAVLHSAEGDRPSNLNRGLAAAAAPVIVRVDARSRVPAHYLRRCLELLGARPDVAVAGGRQRAVAGSERWIDTGVARALNNRWGMGLARYRRPGASGEADTVYLGAYRTEQLLAVGGWRADLAVNEDFDLNRRLRRFGAVWYDGDLAVDYLPRASLQGLLRQYWDFGTGKALYWRVSGDRPQRRQVALLAAPLVAMGLLAAVAVLLGGSGTAVLLGAGAAAALAVEAVGADAPRAGVLGHAAAVAVLGCVAGAWLAGVLVGTLRPVPRRAKAAA